MTVFRAFRHVNYRLFFAGQLASRTGSWMQTVAQSWLVYRLTGSPALLGLVTFSMQAPIFLVSPIGGVLADRFDRRVMLIWVQVAGAVPAAILAALTLADRVEVWHVFVLAAMSGVVNGFDIPMRQAFVVEMVEREDLISAIGLNSSMFHGARTIGPAVAGFLITVTGEGVCFLINALSFVPVLFSFVVMNVPAREQVTRRRHPLAEIREGFVYAATTGPIRMILMIMAAGAFTAVSYVAMMPLFAEEVFRRGATGLGILNAASGAGAVAGALTLASRTSVSGLGRWIAGASGLFGVMLAVFASSRDFNLAVAFLILAGFFQIVLFSSSNTLIQTMVPNALRGRVMSIYSMVFMGAAPLGALFAGSIGERIGAPMIVVVCGAIMMVSSLLFTLRLPAHRVEAQRLIIANGEVPVGASVRETEEQPRKPEVGSRKSKAGRRS